MRTMHWHAVLHGLNRFGWYVNSLQYYHLHTNALTLVRVDHIRPGVIYTQPPEATTTVIRWWLQHRKICVTYHSGINWWNGAPRALQQIQFLESGAGSREPKIKKTEKWKLKWNGRTRCTARHQPKSNPMQQSMRSTVVGPPLPPKTKRENVSCSNAERWIRFRRFRLHLNLAENDARRM